MTAVVIGQREASRARETLRCHGYNERRFVISTREEVLLRVAIWTPESRQDNVVNSVKGNKSKENMDVWH